MYPIQFQTVMTVSNKDHTWNLSNKFRYLARINNWSGTKNENKKKTVSINLRDKSPELVIPAL